MLTCDVITVKKHRNSVFPLERSATRTINEEQSQQLQEQQPQSQQWQSQQSQSQQLQTQT